MLGPDTNNPIEKAVDVSFVNNLGHSWIEQVELYLNDNQIIDLSTPSYAYKPFIDNFLSYSKVKKEVDLRDQLYLDDDDDATRDKFKLAESENLKNRRKLLHGVNENKVYFCIPLNIDFFQTPVFLCPGINLKLKLGKKDELFFLPDRSKAKFRIDYLILRFRLVETAKSVSEDSTKVNLEKQMHIIHII